MKVVPPGGVAGFSQMTPASRMALSKGMGQLRTVRTASQRKGSKAQKRYKQNKRIAGGKPLKFGSPAWRKRFMKGKRAGKGRKRARKK